MTFSRTAAAARTVPNLIIRYFFPATSWLSALTFFPVKEHYKAEMQRDIALTRSVKIFRSKRKGISAFKIN